jgi:hypothetical protein
MKKIAWILQPFAASFFLISAVNASTNECAGTFAETFSAPVHIVRVSEYVKITANAANDTVRAGMEVRLLFHMQPQTGLHVNIEPAISLELINAKNFLLPAKKYMPDSTIKILTTKDGYKIFDPSQPQPVAFAVKVEKGAKPGRYPLKTKLTYYYCSDAEGWCSFASEEFVINLVVVK